jgi:hypothetical protein
MLLAVAGNEIFFPISTLISNGGIGACDIPSGAQRTVAPGTASVSELLADTARVFWVDSSSVESHVHAINVDGTGAVLLASGTRIFQDDEAVYWASGGNICPGREGGPLGPHFARHRQCRYRNCSR